MAPVTFFLIALGAAAAWGLHMISGSPLGNDTASKIANAIAKAEGFFVEGSLPNRTNNPGDLKLGDFGSGTDGGKTVFQSAADGWNALKRQVQLMLNGGSQHYSPNMTIRQVAGIYTGQDHADAWANIVARELGVTPDTKLGDVT